MHEPRIWASSDIHAGLKAEFVRDISEADVAAFADLSRDWNPLHIEASYAAATNYGGRIVHGAFQVALASAMAGMYLPGRSVVVGTFLCRFPAPLSYPSTVLVQGEITTWLPSSARGTLRVRVLTLPALSLTAEIHVGFALHEDRSAPVEQSVAQSADVSGKPIVLVTGARGGLGNHIARSLAKTYQVLAMSRAIPAAPTGGADENLEWVEADLTSPDWEQALTCSLRGRPLYGVAHAAWPQLQQGSLLDAELDTVSAQLEFASVATIRIARFLRSHAAGPGRFVVLGTTAATLKPVLNMGVYSLGKAAMEHTIRLLAPELARAEITMNAVAPSFVPIGMNNSKTSRAVLAETAKVPMGRLCSPDDVLQAVEFFLSPTSAFVTGQMLPLTGGQL